ncbi:MAG: hypothetical protein ACC682_13980 [Gemmatimonadota bacterium]
MKLPAVVRRSPPRALLVAALVSVGMTTAVSAQEHEAEGEHRPNAFAVFLGGAAHLASEGKESESGVAIGLEYTRRLSDRFKLGALAEWASSEESRNFVFLVPLYARVAGNFFLVAGPGIETVPGEGEEKDETGFLARFGAVYEIELDRFVIGPQINADVADGNWTLVYGLTFGIAF